MCMTFLNIFETLRRLDPPRERAQPILVLGSASRRLLEVWFSTVFGLMQYLVLRRGNHQVDGKPYLLRREAGERVDCLDNGLRCVGIHRSIEEEVVERLHQPRRSLFREDLAECAGRAQVNVETRYAIEYKEVSQGQPVGDAAGVFQPELGRIVGRARNHVAGREEVEYRGGLKGVFAEGCDIARQCLPVIVGIDVDEAEPAHYAGQPEDGLAQMSVAGLLSRVAGPRFRIGKDSREHRLHVAAHTVAVVFEDGATRETYSGLGMLFTRC